MQEIFNFLIEVGKLKRMPRRGWVINQIKKPESIAEHIFRAAIMGWILGKEKTGLNVERLLKMALIHDLCEIYAGDETPYDSILPKNKKKLRELMKTWPRFPSSERERKIYSKHQREKKSLKKLVTGLPKNFKNEILNLWLDYESCLTPEGRFLHQADRMENFLQAYEYWKKYKNPPLGPWWLWAREFFDDPLLLKFMEVLEKKFHQQKIPERLKSSIALLNFFSEVGKLKRKPRRGWIIHQIKNPETTAEHIFRMAIIAWALGKKKRLNIERVIKMALIHDLCEVYAPDLTPYDPLLPKDQKKIMETLKHWPKFTPSLKVKTYKKKYKLEKPYILSVGTKEPRKNIKRLIEAFVSLGRSDIELVLVGKRGWGEEVEVGKAKVKELGFVEDKDLPALYSGAILFAYPSLYEGFGFPVLEAMACGCPVITSNISSLPEVVGQTALLVYPKETKEIANAINTLLNDDKLRQKLVKNGLEQAKKFSWEKTANQMIKTYQDINNVN